MRGTEKEKRVGENEKKPRNKKRIVTIVLIVIFVLAAAGYWFVKIRPGKTADSVEKYLTDMAAQTTDAVTAYGVISVGTVEETLDVEKMDSALTVEEILFESGDSVQEGDALVAFTEESVETAKEELEKNLLEAELAYRSGAIEYEQSLITAKYTYESTLLTGKQADEVYEETVANLTSTLEAAEKTYTEAKEQLAEYEDAAANNTYYEEYKVKYYEDLYNENLEVLKKKIEEWGVPWEEVTRGGGRLGPDTYSQYQYILQQLYRILETNLSDYDKAKENYENSQEDLAYNLLSLQLDMSTIEETYLNAQKSYEANLLSAEQTRQTSKTNAELAESTYEATVEKAKTDYDSLKSAYEDAQSDYDTFTARMDGNKYTAANSGTVMRSTVRTNGTVSAGSRIVMYSDTSDITVTVSVDQADIAKLAVGDSAICYASDTGMLTGTIQSISPVTQSSSISSVTYSVIVRLDETDAEVKTNTSVTVIFGMDMSTASGFDFSSVAGSSEENGMPNFGGDFDFSNMPNMGNMPGMGGAPNFGSGS